MEVDDDILYSPEAAPRYISRASSYTRANYAHCLASIASQALSLGTSRPPTRDPKLSPLLMDNNLQGSVELEDTQRFLNISPETFILETQMDYLIEASREVQRGDDSQYTSKPPQSSYFCGASQQLDEPIRKFDTVRLRSMPVRYNRTLRDGTGLKTLTRQASMGSGTVPTSRKKIMSLLFNPPFKT